MVRRRAYERDARRGVPQLGDQAGDLEAGQLPALPGLGALGHLDLDLLAGVQVFRRYAEPAGADLLDGGTRVVPVGARLRTLRVLAALAAVAAGADAVHGDAQRLMRLGAERAQRDARRHQALADFGDALDLIDLDGLDAIHAEIQQVAQRHRLLPAHAISIAAIRLEAVRRHRRLQGVDQPAVEGMHLALAAQLIHAADRQGVAVAVPRRLVQPQHLAGDALQPDAADAGLHAGEVLGNQGARQADGLEVVAAAVAADDRDAHLGHDLQQALVDGLLVVLHRLLQSDLGEQAAAVAVSNALLRQIGVHRRGADADQHGEVVRVHALRAAHVQAGEGAQGLADQMRVHGASGQDHWDRRAFGSLRLVRQDHVGAAGAHALLGLAPDALKRCAQLGLAMAHGEGAVHPAGGGAHGGSHRLELGVGQHGAVQLQQVALAAVLIQDVAQVAQPGLQRHHPRLPQGVDGRVGDLAEPLAEVVVQAAVALGQHGDRRVVTHAADGLGAVLHHRVQDHLQLFQRGAHGQLAAAQLGRVVHDRLRRIGFDDAVKLSDAPGPGAEVLPGGQHVLQLAIEVEPGFVQIDADALARPNPALGHDLGFRELHHARLGPHDQQVVGRHSVAQGAQAVAV